MEMGLGFVHRKIESVMVAGTMIEWAKEFSKFEMAMMITGVARWNQWNPLCMILHIQAPLVVVDLPPPHC